MQGETNLRSEVAVDARNIRGQQGLQVGMGWREEDVAANRRKDGWKVKDTCSALAATKPEQK